MHDASRFGEGREYSYVTYKDVYEWDNQLLPISERAMDNLYAELDLNDQKRGLAQSEQVCVQQPGVAVA